MREARENGLNIGFVSVTDRKAVVDWLEGRVADLASIVPIAGTSALVARRQASFQCMSWSRRVNDTARLTTSSCVYIATRRSRQRLADQPGQEAPVCCGLGG